MQLTAWQQLFMFTLSILHLQPDGAAGTMVFRAGKNAEGGGSCARLGNRGSYFDIEIEVGTPGQKFAVVADTGSNSLIVPSCACRKMGYCSKATRCFLGFNRSSTFLLRRVAGGKAKYVMLTFGSGVVQGAIAQETVRIGKTVADMKDGIVLMTQKVLRFPGHFEGLLGLGIPSSEPKKLEKKKKESIFGKILQKLKKNMGDYGRRAQESTHKSLLSLTNMSTALSGSASSPAGFMEQAGVKSFSICFNRGTDGVLRIEPPSLPVVMPTLALQHWSLALNGVSIGNSKRNVTVCSPSQKNPWQESPCAAVPDSGTTLILAPAQHIKLLTDDLCDSWPRCRQQHTKLHKAAAAASKAAAEVYGFNPFRLFFPTKLRVMESLVKDCSSWLDEEGSGGLSEMPELRFQISGNNGTGNAELKLPPRAYVFQRTVKQKVASLTEQVEGAEGGIDDASTLGAKMSLASSNVAKAGNISHANSARRECSLAFGVANYGTSKNGPAWILGTPFFYEFEIGFDHSSKTPALSFRQLNENAPCGGCDGGGSLATASTSTDGTAASNQLPRWSGAARMPSYSADEPLF